MTRRASAAAGSADWHSAGLQVSLQELLELKGRLLQVQSSRRKAVKGLPPSRRASAVNQAQYMAFRSTDLRSLQIRLSRLGLSSLGRCETDVLANLDSDPGEEDQQSAGPPPARTGCTLPQALRQARVGQSIWFDDGRLGGVIEAVAADGVGVRITQALDGGDKLMGDQGINLPDTMQTAVELAEPVVWATQVLQTLAKTGSRPAPRSPMPRCASGPSA